MKTIPLTQGKVAIVDDEDFVELSKSKWYYHSSGYAVRNDYSNRKHETLKMHRIVLKPKDGEWLDHINSDRLDNRKENLRVASPSQNAWNSRQPKNYHSSSYKGVSKHKRQNGQIAWRARISLNWKNISLGVFDTPEEAARAYDKKARELFGEFAKINNKQTV